MADKTYVCVAPVEVKEVFDNKYKTTLPKLNPRSSREGRGPLRQRGALAQDSGGPAEAGPLIPYSTSAPSEEPSDAGTISQVTLSPCCCV